MSSWAVIKTTLLAGLAFQASPALAISEFDRWMGFAAHGASMGIYLPEIEQQIAMVRAESKKQQVLFEKQILESGAARAKAALLATKSRLDEEVPKLKRQLQKSKDFFTAAERSAELCFEWEKKANQSQLRFKNIKEDIELQIQLDISALGNSEVPCQKIDRASCPLGKFLGELTASKRELQDATKKAETLISPTDISKACESYDTIRFKALEQKVRIEKLIKTSEIKLSATENKLKGYK